MTTRTQILDRHGIEPSLDDSTVADIEVPILTSLQRQGDVIIRPVDRAPTAGAIRVPPEGVALVVGEATGNTHLLAPEPEALVWWRPAPTSFDGGVVLGEIHVQTGAAWLIHTDEHGIHGIGPGIYEARGKRTQREEIERVQD